MNDILYFQLFVGVSDIIRSKFIYLFDCFLFEQSWSGGWVQDGALFDSGQSINKNQTSVNATLTHAHSQSADKDWEIKKTSVKMNEPNRGSLDLAGVSGPFSREREQFTEKILKGLR